MLKPYSDHLCGFRKQQQQQQQQQQSFSAESIANALDRDPSLRAAFDRALQTQLDQEIKKKGEPKNESPDT